jgi:hypothetical protein
MNIQESIKVEPVPEPQPKVYKATILGWNPNVKASINEKFIQGVTFMMVGGDQWPNHIEFACVFGNEIKPYFEGSIVQNQPMKIYFVAPEKPGRYFATYRLKADGQEFGEKLYLNLAVEEPLPELVAEPEVKPMPQGSSLIESGFMPPAAEQSPKLDDKPMDKASIMVSAIEQGDDDLQKSFEVISPEP